MIVWLTQLNLDLLVNFKFSLLRNFAFCYVNPKSASEELFCSLLLRKSSVSRKHNSRHRNTFQGQLNLVGPVIAAIRKNKKPPLTQEDLAGKLATQGILIDRSGVAKIEKQKRTVIDIELRAIAKALKVSPNELFPT